MGRWKSEYGEMMSERIEMQECEFDEMMTGLPCVVFAVMIGGVEGVLPVPISIGFQVGWNNKKTSKHITFLKYFGHMFNF